MFDPEFARRAEATARWRAREATFVACMSAATRDTDLCGVLGLPAEKIRVVETAIPLDFPVLSPEEARATIPRRLARPYLFYPTAFRPYKNHAGLVRAARVLRADFGVADFDLVFTGNIDTPVELARLVASFGLGDRVHSLGRVSREELAALYQCSYATVVPSLFEQGSYQIAEALHFGSPVACSDIRPFRDQCATMGDAMTYFDPNTPRSIAEAVLAIRHDREGVRLRQKRAAVPMLTRTWDAVAQEWLAVFREAHAVASSGRQEAA
jgi:glycosyltransferase involved in cell wall biosynthesis